MRPTFAGRRSLTAACVGLALALAGCRGGEVEPATGSSGAPGRDTAVVQFQQEPDTLNPFLSPMSVTSAVAALFYSGLVLLNDKGDFAPDLATSVPTVANGGVVLQKNGMRVTYRLRPGARWQDGRPVVANDVVATFKLLTNPGFAAVSTAGYDRIRTIETPDAATVVVVFKESYAPYLELFPYVLPAHVISTGANPGSEPWNRKPMGSGPYVFERWNSGDRLVARANPSYFRGKPAIPRLELRFVTQDISAFNLWKTGELDLFQGASPAQYDYLQREAPSRVHLTQAPTWEHILFNMTHPVLSDVRVRRAIAHLIDRQQLNSAAYGGVFQPAWSEVPSGSWAYHRSVENRYAPSPKDAARLLDEAGWLRDASGVRKRKGQPLALRLLTTSDKPGRSLAAQLWRRQWQDAGITLTIEKLPASLVFGSSASGGRLATGQFDLALIAGVARPDPDSSFRWRSDQLPPNGQNRARYRSPAADRLLWAGQRTVAIAQRKPIYAALAEQLALDLPAIPLLYWVGIDATSDRLQGYRANPTLRGNLWNVWEWKLGSQ